MATTSAPKPEAASEDPPSPPQPAAEEDNEIGAAAMVALPMAVEEAAARTAVKRYEGLLTVRAKAVKGKGAWYWAHLEPILVPPPESGLPAKAVKLRCSLCAALFSASNPSRTASEHLKRGTCPHFAAPPPPPSTSAPTSPVPISSMPPPPALQIPHQHHHRRHHHSGRKRLSSSNASTSSSLVPFDQPSFFSPPAAPPAPLRVLSGGKDDIGALAMLEDNVKRLKSPKYSPGPALPRPQAEAAMALLVGWFHECAGAGAASLSAVEHPKLLAFLRHVGLPPLSRRDLAGALLDSRFSDARNDAGARVRDALFFQLAADGFRQPVVTCAVNLPNGTSVFHRAISTPAPPSPEYAEQLILEAMVDVSGSGNLHRCAGVVTDRFKSSALRALETKHHWLVNLSCQIHGFSSLLRDFARELPVFRHVAAGCARLAAVFNGKPEVQTLFHKYQRQELGRAGVLLRVAPLSSLEQKGADFGPVFAMLDDVVASYRALQRTAADEAYKLAGIDDQSVRELGDMVKNVSFWTELQAVHWLVRTVSAMVREMETDRPVIGQCLPLWEELRGKVRDWCDKFSIDEDAAMSIVDRRFKKNYHPAWSAAYILDPLYLLKDASGRYLPPFKCLSPEQEKDVDRLITRMVSGEEAHLALMELMKWRSEGLDPLYAQAVQVRQPDPATGKLRVANKQSSRLVWETCLSEFKLLGRVAVRLIFLHATSGGFKCSPGVVRWLSAGGSERAHKLVFVAANAKLERRDFAAEEDKDAELFSDGGGGDESPPPASRHPYVGSPQH